MHKTLLRLALVSAVCLSFTSCTFYSIATHWNGRIGPNHEPVYYASVSKIGFNLLILIPFLGHTTIDSMIDEATEEIEKRGGDVVRIVQGGTDNYWYGWSPFTWIITPVVASIDAEYQPSAAELEKNRKEQAEAESGS